MSSNACNTTELIARYDHSEWLKIQSRYVNCIKNTPKTNKQILFEEIDPSKYNSSAKCVSFRTSVERMPTWIYTLCLRYHDQLGESDDFDIEWRDKHDDNPANILDIKIIINDISAGKREGVKLFCITLYLSTLTVLIQGNKCELFAKEEFPTLKETVDFFMENQDVPDKPTKVASETYKSNEEEEGDIACETHEEGDTFVDASPHASSPDTDLKAVDICETGQKSTVTSKPFQAAGLSSTRKKEEKQSQDKDSEISLKVNEVPAKNNKTKSI